MVGVASPVDPRFPPYTVLPEPMLAFDVRDPARQHAHPLRGLDTHGPYHGTSFAAARQSIRLAVVAPADRMQHLFTFLGSLRLPHEPQERKGYLPAFRGFREVFGTDLVPADSAAQIALDSNLVGDVETPSYASLANALGDALRRLNLVRHLWDVAVVLLPARWERARTSGDGAFDIHDHVKSVAAPLGMPTQLLWEQSALAYKDRCSVAWRLSIALYAKAGGIPWRLVVDEDVSTAYIGLAYAIRGGTRDAFVTCCSQVFDGDGGGMDFVAYDVGEGVDLENPHLSRSEMRAVMARSARLYQARHAGQMPRRVVVHKTTRFRDEEVDGVVDAWSASDVECVHVQAGTQWRAVHLLAPKASATARSSPDSWPVRRGTLVPVSGRAVMLFVNGTAPGLSASAGNFYQGAKSIPRPLILTRDAGAGSLEFMGSEALALTKMDWNNDALYDPMPVTIRYSKTLADVISHVEHLPNAVYPYRLFM